jgi:3-hydroxybutyryl-CoA dehydrogenase
MSASLENTTVAVIGAGIMGTGIAQVAAQAGHSVLLFDVIPGAATAAREKLNTTFETLVAKGKFSRDSADATLASIEPIESLDRVSEVGLVIEAVIEDLPTKQDLFRQLEGVVDRECILASNTSSLSVTAIANGLQFPGRLLGMHFFNPVALMKLVEVVSGLQTSTEVSAAICALAESWGKVAVMARSTPGFIVNRIARPFYAEALALLQEQATTPAALDACLRAAGFRMGPCELMDLIGHDTNFAVTLSVYTANYYDKRFAPSLVQQQLVDGGLLGRKTGRGFYNYDQPFVAPGIEYEVPESLPATENLRVHGSGPVANHIAKMLSDHAGEFEHVDNSDWCGLQVGDARLRLTDGRPASQLGGETAVFDLPLATDTGKSLAWSHAATASRQWIDEATQWLAIFGFQPQCIADVPGLVVARTVAMLINEAADAVQQEVCTEAGADTAMKLGVNYPAGPFEWLADWNVNAVIEILDGLDDYYRGERYRVSPWLRHKAWQGRSQ